MINNTYKTQKSPITAKIINKNGEETKSFEVTNFNDHMIFSRSAVLNMPNVTPAELGLIIYISAWNGSPEKHDPITAFDVMNHFPNSNPLEILYTLKSLVAKNLMHPNQELHDAIADTINTQRHKD